MSLPVGFRKIKALASEHHYKEPTTEEGFGLSALFVGLSGAQVGQCLRQDAKPEGPLV